MWWLLEMLWADPACEEPLRVGERVRYRGREKGTVVAVHLDDPDGAYYTVRMDRGAREVQTVARHLTRVDRPPKVHQE